MPPAPSAFTSEGSASPRSRSAARRERSSPSRISRYLVRVRVGVRVGVRVRVRVRLRVRLRVRIRISRYRATASSSPGMLLSCRLE
jgi:hypothetical protein